MCRHRRRVDGEGQHPGKATQHPCDWSDDLGHDNISAYNRGMPEGSTPNIDRTAREGVLFPDCYAEQSCTAGSASCMLGQNPFRTGLLTVNRMRNVESGLLNHSLEMIERAHTCPRLVARVYKTPLLRNQFSRMKEMSYQPKAFVLALSIILVIPSASALGQISQGVGNIGGRETIGGARPGTGGVRGLSSPRSGLGTGGNPIVNPSPSLTPHEVLNPRGSLSSGQVLNPAPSLGRPRSGGAMSRAQQSAAAGGSTSRSARPHSSYDTTSHLEQLIAQLRTHKNGASWAEYLAPPKEPLSDNTTAGASERRSELLKRFNKLNSDPTYAKVTALPAFGPAFEALKIAVETEALATPSANTQPIGGSGYRSARPNMGESILLAINPAPTSLAVGDRILQSVVALDRQLAKVAPDSEWPKRLSLDELRVTISVTSQQPASDDERKSMEKILAIYQAVANNEQDAVVNQMPEFKKTLDWLQEYLSPIDLRRRRDLRRESDQLGDQLRKYKNGEPWATYLAPPKELLDDQTAEATSDQGTSDLGTKLLARFGKLISDPTYTKVTSLPAFGPTHESLKLVVHRADTSHPSDTPNEQPIPAQDDKPVAAEGPKSVMAGDQQPVVAAEQSPDPRPLPADGDRTEPITVDAAPKRSVGTRVLHSVVKLDRQLGNLATDKDWSKRLSLDELRIDIPATSDQPASESDRKTVQDILETYRDIANNKENAIVNELPEFKEILEALQEYLKPLETQPPKD
jgi:hypothetical protein